MPLPLHIFEERYKRMVRHCLETDQLFGAVLIQDGREIDGSPAPHMVGTYARIHAAKELKEGRLNILVVGTDRFRLTEYMREPEPYMLGIGEPICDAEEDQSVLTPLANDVSALFQNYFHLLTEQAGVEMPEFELPENPSDLSFVVAAAVQLPNPTRQEYLEITDTVQRLTQERELLTVEIARVKTLTAGHNKQAKRLNAVRIKQLVNRN